MNPDRNPDGSCAADGLVGIVWYGRKAIGWAASWAVYAVGEWLLQPIVYREWGPAQLFNVYTGTLALSIDLQKWGGWGVDHGWGPWCKITVKK